MFVRSMIFRFLILAALFGAAQVQAQTLNLQITPHGNVSGWIGFGQQPQQRQDVPRHYAPHPGWQPQYPRPYHMPPPVRRPPPYLQTLCQDTFWPDGQVTKRCWDVWVQP